MEWKKKYLNESPGFSLLELVLVMLVFSISIVPIYKMIVASAQMQKSSEETYEATLQAQNLLHQVKKQIERDIGDEYRASRGLRPEAVKAWLNPQTNSQAINPSLTHFLSQVEDFDQFKSHSFLYEVHIWPIKEGQVQIDRPVSFFSYDQVEKPEEFTMIEIEESLKDYFDYKEDPLLWINPQDPDHELETDLKAVAEISYDSSPLASHQIKIRSSGIKSSFDLADIAGYKALSQNTSLSCKHYKDGATNTYELVIEADSPGALKEQDMIYLALDLTSFPRDISEIILRVENRAKATVLMPVYNEKSESEKAPLRIFPIQHKTGGKMIIEKRQQRAPSKNFVIGIIVRDALNSGFGDPHKVLSKMVDLYSYDYKEH